MTVFMFEGQMLRDFMRQVFAITEDTEAKEFYEAYVEFLRTVHDLDGVPEYVAQANIGFCFGENMPREKQQMWVRVCNATHPWFGQHVPTDKEAFEMGMRAGTEIGEGK